MKITKTYIETNQQKEKKKRDILKPRILLFVSTSCMINRIYKNHLVVHLVHQVRFGTTR
jgi:hypothetical protein